MTCSRPIVHYHGGKWMLAPWIISYFPAHRIYVEPFGGGGSVLLRKPRARAEVYNDLDGELVNLFRAARDHGEDLRRALELTPFSRVEFEASYEPTDDPLEQARRTIVRAFMGFGSNSHNKATGFRSNSNRSGTTPAMDWRHYPGEFGAIIERLRGVVIENRDALEVLQIHDGPATLHYVDPPYLAETRDAGDDYRFELDESAHVRLAEILRGLQGAVVVSGYPSPLYEDLYAGWTRAERAALADGAAPRTEVLWMKGIDLGLFGAAP
jgi:DNA adenine methylase